MARQSLDNQSFYGVLRIQRDSFVFVLVALCPLRKEMSLIVSIPWLIFSAIVCAFIWYRFQLQDKETRSRFPQIFRKSRSDLEDFEIRILNQRSETQRTFAITALVVVIFSVWMGAWRPHQVIIERENQHQAYLASYLEGWNFYCDEIFDNTLNSISPNGILYAGSNQFTASWCQGLFGYGDAESAYLEDGGGAMSEYSDVDGSKSDGLNAGYRDSRKAVFLRVPYLCYGTECISDDTETSRLEDRAYQDWKNDQENN